MLLLPLKNKNRTQNLLTKTVAKSIPKLGTYSNKPAIAHVKFFLNDFTWFCCEFDPETGRMYGYVYSSACPDGEYGYFDINELASVCGRIGNAVERDKWFRPMTIESIQERKGMA